MIITLVPQGFDKKGYEKGYVEGMKKINQLLNLLPLTKHY